MSATYVDLLPDSIRPVTDPIYHYTSPAGLLGLVRDRVLWASEASSLNDLAEVRAGWDLVRRWVASMPRTERLRSVAKRARKLSGERQTDVYVACCSTASDDAAQWRSYASGAAGYVLELDPSIPLAIWTEDPAPSPPATRARLRTMSRFLRDSGWVTPWYPVIYDKDDAVTVLDHVLASANMTLRRIESTEQGDSPDDEFEYYRDSALEELAEEFCGSLSIVAHLLKGEGFSGEHEVRAFAGVMSRQRHQVFRAGPNGVIGHFALTASRPSGVDKVVRSAGSEPRPADPLPIRSVTLGSRLGKENRVTVERLLAANGLKGTRVRRSSLRMR